MEVLIWFEVLIVMRLQWMVKVGSLGLGWKTLQMCFNAMIGFYLLLNKSNAKTSSSAMRSFIPTSWNPLSSNLHAIVIGFLYALLLLHCTPLLLYLVLVSLLLSSVSLLTNSPRDDPSDDAALNSIWFDHYVGLLHPLHLLVLFEIFLVTDYWFCFK